jgi:hypothetical protein
MTKRMIGIIGSRRRDSARDYELTRAKFLSIYSPCDEIVSGGCPKGGDHFAELIAQLFQVPITIHYPDKSKLDMKLMKLNPRAAFAKIAFARNGLIARDADVMIAVVAPDRKGGTEDTLKTFRKKLGMTESQLITERRLHLV